MFLQIDIKLLRLLLPARHTKPARLPTKEEAIALTREGTMLTLAGWGSKKPHVIGENSATMLHVKVPVVTNEVCGDVTHYGDTDPPDLPKTVYPSMLCAGYDGGGRDSCYGNSGGPLFSIEEGEGVVLGLVSWAAGCGLPKRPGAYTRVAHYSAWITQTISIHTAAAATAAKAAASSYAELSAVKAVRDTNYKYSCKHKCGHSSFQTGFSGEGMCSCERKCMTTGDCCTDFLSECTSYIPGTGLQSKMSTAIEALVVLFRRISSCNHVYLCVGTTKMKLRLDPYSPTSDPHNLNLQQVPNMEQKIRNNPCAPPSTQNVDDPCLCMNRTYTLLYTKQSKEAEQSKGAKESEEASRKGQCGWSRTLSKCLVDATTECEECPSQHHCKSKKAQKLQNEGKDRENQGKHIEL